MDAFQCTFIKGVSISENIQLKETMYKLSIMQLRSGRVTVAVPAVPKKKTPVAAPVPIVVPTTVKASKKTPVVAPVPAPVEAPVTKKRSTKK